MPRSGSLYAVRPQGSAALPRKRPRCNPQRALFLKRCLTFFCFAFAFSTVGFVLLLATVLFPEGNWDKLIYLAAGIFSMSLICWACWFQWDFEPGFRDIEANAAGAAVTTTEARASGSSNQATQVSSEFQGRATPVGHSLASPQGSSRDPQTKTGSFSSLSRAFSAVSPGSGGTGWVTRLRLQSRAVGSWMAKHLRPRGSMVAVLPQVWAPRDRAQQAPQKPGPSPGRGPRLVSSHTLPRPQPSPATWSSMPTLSTAGLPPCLLPPRSCSSPWLPQLLTGQSLQATLRCPPRAPVQGHPPAAQSPALAWPGGPRPLGPPFLQPPSETTMPQPVPSLCRTAGDHADAPVLRASSREGTTVRKILVQPRTPGQVQQPQGPGSPGADAGDPRVSDLCPVDC